MEMSWFPEQHFFLIVSAKQIYIFGLILWRMFDGDVLG